MTDVESTSVKPRQRPRAVDSSARQTPPSGVGGNVTSETLSATAAAVGNAISQQQQLVEQPHQMQSQQKQHELSDQLSRSNEMHSTQPLDDMSSLIDLDPESTLLANLDPLASSLPAYPTAGQQFRPSFGYNVPHADPFMSSYDGRFNSLPGQSVRHAASFAAYPSTMVPRPLVSYSMHGCAQQAIGHPTAVPYAPLRMMMPQYCSAVAQGKTGSNNDLHMLQVRHVNSSISCRFTCQI